jgi:hypothetical protein
MPVIVSTAIVGVTVDPSGAGEGCGAVAAGCGVGASVVAAGSGSIAGFVVGARADAGGEGEAAHAASPTTNATLACKVRVCMGMTLAQ